jgi:filamentous hemagglutinin family protein
MKSVACQTLFASIINLCCLFITSSFAQAQISADRTLPTNVSQVGNLFEITGGAKASSNLFHSFLEFSVPTGNTAFFNNALDISNIISRVTGGSISNLNGLIRANGSANFILINPNGINFGPNAQLNIGGSFLASTASSIKFVDGVEFSATNTQTSPILTIAVPLGLQFGQNPGAIGVQGTGHNLTLQSQIFSPFTRGSTTGLKVQPGHTLALVGGDITLQGGTLTAEGGRIELGSVGGGLVSLNPSSQGWNLGYQGVSNFRGITLSQKALADASGVGSGSIQLQGRSIAIQDGSAVLIQTQGVQPAGNINVNVSESLKLIGTTPDGQIASNIVTETIGSGKNGDITITTPRLVLQDAAVISAANFTSAIGGNVTVNAPEFIDVIGYSSVNPNRFSTISATTFGSGKAGNITLSTRQLTAKNGGNIVSITSGLGSAGNVVVNASELVELIGVEPIVLTPSQISAGTGGSGKAGSVTVNTKRLAVQNGGRVDASTLASGSAGSVTINATDSVEVSGTVPGSLNPSLIISSANIVDPSLQQLLRLPPVPSGKAGDVTINTSQLTVTDGALITASNQGAGASGNIRITADSVFLNGGGGITSELGGTYKAGQFSFFSPITLGANKGGDITISTKQLVVQSGAGISTATFTNATGGDVTVNVSKSMQVIGSPSVNPNALSFIGASTVGSGNSGNLNISTGKLTVLNGGLVSAGTFGSGTGGDVTVNARESVEVIGVEPRQLTSSLVGVSTLGRGNAGNLTINTPRLIVQDGGRVDSSTAAAGSAGSITINAPKSVEVRGTVPGTSIPSLVSSGANIENEFTRQLFRLPPIPTGSSKDVTINTGQLLITNGAQVSATNQGLGNAGNVRVNAHSLLVDYGSSITAATQSGEGGNIFLQTNTLQMRHGSQISSQAGQTGNGGNITITGHSPANYVVLLEGSKIDANAFQGRGGNIQINTTGLFTCLECQITASSQLGVNGVVRITTPETNPKQEAINFPLEIAKSEEIVAQICPANKQQHQSEFTITGRGGLPPRPNESLSSEALLSFESSSTQTEHLSHTAIAQEKATASELPPPAQGWYVNSKGAVVLTAQAPTPTPYASGFSSLSCYRTSAE